MLLIVFALFNPLKIYGNNIAIGSKVRCHTPSPQSGPLPLS